MCISGLFFVSKFPEKMGVFIKGHKKVIRRVKITLLQRHVDISVRINMCTKCSHAFLSYASFSPLGKKPSIT